MSKAKSSPRVLLMGNPNAGKTSLFNALTGHRARTGNFPGITVEHRYATMSLAPGAGGDVTANLFDLPGTYSLNPFADDEREALRLLTQADAPDVVVVVVDSTHIVRNLYLVDALIEIDAPLLVALTMTDELDASGATLDTDALADRLGVPVVAASPRRPGEVAAARAAIASMVEKSRARDTPPKRLVCPPSLKAQSDEEAASTYTKKYQRFEAIYRDVVVSKTASTVAPSLDRYFLHPLLGPLLFVALFAALFLALFSWVAPVMDGIEALTGAVSAVVLGAVPESWPLFRSLLKDGVFSGVGNVIVFTPQIFVLFFFLALFEDSGLLARAAFLIDRVMSAVGLHGRAFVPFLSGFACAVPAIMATRTIRTEADRIATIMVTPLISCSARLPVYTLIIATLFADAAPLFGVVPVAPLVFVGAYTISLLAAIGIAFVLKRTVLKGPPPALVLELPPYRRPPLGHAVQHALSRVGVFVRDAGTVIFAFTIILWALFTFPQDDAINAKLAALPHANVTAVSVDSRPRQEGATDAGAALRQQALEHSFAGRVGRFFEPVLTPLGYDWKIGVALIASFAAREVFVSSLGLVYGLGEDSDEESVSLRETVKAQRYADGCKVFTPLSGISLIVFFLFAMQCMSTLAATKRETRSYRWPLFQFVYMTALAYVCALLVYQGGLALGFT